MRKFILFALICLLSFTSIFAGNGKERTTEFKKVSKFNYSQGLNKVAGTIFLEESFENDFPPLNWYRISIGDAEEQWEQSSSNARTGNYSAYLKYSPSDRTMDEWLITPAIDLSDLTTEAKLVFFEDESYWSSYGIQHSIKISTTSQTDESSFDDVFVMTPSDHTIYGFSGDPVEISLAAYTGESNVYIAFHYSGSDADNWYIDDIRVTEVNEHDVKSISLDANEHYDPYSIMQPKATVKNVGLNVETFEVVFGYLNWDGSQVVLDTKTVNNLARDESVQVTFNDYTFARVYQYEFFVMTNLSGDEDTSNDIKKTTINSFTQKKSMVLLEKATGTWCIWCPGSARAADQLYKDHPDSISVIEYHGGDDTFVSPMSESRISFYEISGYPTALFNGTHISGGGALVLQDWTPIYTRYDSIYQVCKEEVNPFNLELKFFEDGLNITAISTTTYTAVSYLKKLQIRYSLVESHIAYNWQSAMDSLQFVARELYPDYVGKSFYTSTSAPTVGTMVSDTIEFVFPGNVVKENADLIVFIQNDDTKEIIESARISMNNPVSSINNTMINNIPNNFQLEQNFPNPFNPETNIGFVLPMRAKVQLTVYNLEGRKIETLINGILEKGKYQFKFNGTDMASGLYFYKLESENFISTRKMLLVK